MACWARPFSSSCGRSFLEFLNSRIHRFEAWLFIVFMPPWAARTVIICRTSMEALGPVSYESIYVWWIFQMPGNADTCMRRTTRSRMCVCKYPTGCSRGCDNTGCVPSLAIYKDRRCYSYSPTQLSIITTRLCPWKLWNTISSLLLCSPTSNFSLYLLLSFRFQPWDQPGWVHSCRSVANSPVV